jgi:hypothetical protein
LTDEIENHLVITTARGIVERTVSIVVWLVNVGAEFLNEVSH